MKKYGLPYKGSKSKIADELIAVMPSGNRFIDLFGGGGAVSHCACLSGKYNSVLYREIRQIMCCFLKDVIDGKYNIKTFVPEWISRDEFNKKKNTDGYIASVWSFGNNCRDYLYSKQIEEYKHKVHDFVVFGKADEIFKDVLSSVTADNIADRRLQFSRAIKGLENVDYRIPHLERLERLEKLEHLERLEIQCGDYRDYIYHDGDIVYCDIPYEQDSRDSYYCHFDYPFFYEWVKNRPYQVWFSSYNGVDGFKRIWEKPITTCMAANNNAIKRIECLYTNR